MVVFVCVVASMYLFAMAGSSPQWPEDPLEHSPECQTPSMEPSNESSHESRILRSCIRQNHATDRSSFVSDFVDFRAFDRISPDELTSDSSVVSTRTRLKEAYHSFIHRKRPMRLYVIGPVIACCALIIIGVVIATFNFIGVYG